MVAITPFPKPSPSLQIIAEDDKTYLVLFPTSNGDIAAEVSVHWMEKSKLPAAHYPVHIWTQTKAHGLEALKITFEQGKKGVQGRAQSQSAQLVMILVVDDAVAAVLHSPVSESVWTALREKFPAGMGSLSTVTVEAEGSSRADTPQKTSDFNISEKTSGSAVPKETSDSAMPEKASGSAMPDKKSSSSVKEEGPYAAQDHREHQSGYGGYGQDYFIQPSSDDEMPDVVDTVVKIAGTRVDSRQAGDDLTSEFVEISLLDDEPNDVVPTQRGNSFLTYHGRGPLDAVRAANVKQPLRREEDFVANRRSTFFGNLRNLRLPDSINPALLMTTFRGKVSFDLEANIGVGPLNALFPLCADCGIASLASKTSPRHPTSIECPCLRNNNDHWEDAKRTHMERTNCKTKCFDCSCSLKGTEEVHRCAGCSGWGFQE